MEPSVKILDHNSLDKLQETQHSVNDSIMKLLAHISEYFDSLIEGMEEQKRQLEEQVEAAKERLDQAEKDYSDCLSSQEYDEEDHCYRPSCDCEAADVDNCREEYDKLKENDEKAERVLSESKNELSKYREDSTLYTGGEATMKKLVKKQESEAKEKMDKIRECVSKYLSISCSISAARLGRSEEQAQLYEEGVRDNAEKAEAEEARSKATRAETFHEATTSLQKKMSEMGYRSADTIAICPGCKRPVNVCICQHILERSR